MELLFCRPPTRGWPHLSPIVCGGACLYGPAHCSTHAPGSACAAPASSDGPPPSVPRSFSGKCCDPCHPAPTHLVASPALASPVGSTSSASGTLPVPRCSLPTWASSSRSRNSRTSSEGHPPGHPRSAGPAGLRALLSDRGGIRIEYAKNKMGEVNCQMVNSLLAPRTETAYRTESTEQDSGLGIKVRSKSWKSVLKTTLELGREVGCLFTKFDSLVYNWYKTIASGFGTRYRSPIQELEVCFEKRHWSWDEDSGLGIEVRSKSWKSVLKTTLELGRGIKNLIHELEVYVKIRLNNQSRYEKQLRSSQSL
ncbi:hypothetical protein CEXT_685141 [Caerostris extrusa]|uniref:Uncharacterized protein n=1 Tax=Caerostris extrusa TaxID=172846 RepID=A0AAV4R5V8_CAEEX|nr:hypothetical protein CEXT_685141 [Caerostris extrusa]